eukprot:7092229-Prymnesium_polylepis.1
MQSLRLVACMSAPRDTTPLFLLAAVNRRRLHPPGGDAVSKSRMQIADCVRPRQLTTSASVARYHPTIMFEKLRTTVCAQAETIYKGLSCCALAIWRVKFMFASLYSFVTQTLDNVS